MAQDLDYRAEALDVGDEIRWMGRWYLIVRKRIAWGLNRQSIVFDLKDDGPGIEPALTVVYRFGVWVAARPIVREEAS